MTTFKDISIDCSRFTNLKRGIFFLPRGVILVLSSQKLISDFIKRLSLNPPVLLDFNNTNKYRKSIQIKRINGTIWKMIAFL